MWILCLAAEDSLETSNLIFSEKQWKGISAAVVIGALRGLGCMFIFINQTCSFWNIPSCFNKNTHIPAHRHNKHTCMLWHMLRWQQTETMPFSANFNLGQKTPLSLQTLSAFTLYPQFSNFPRSFNIWIHLCVTERRLIMDRLDCKTRVLSSLLFLLFYSILSHNLGRSSGHHRWICNNPFPSWPVFSCPSWAGKVHSCPLFDIVFPPLLLSASFSFSFHCSL